MSGSHTILLWETAEDLGRRLTLHLEGARRLGQRVRVFSPDSEKLQGLVGPDLGGFVGESSSRLDELWKKVGGEDLGAVIRDGVQKSWRGGNSGLFAVIHHEKETVEELGFAKILRREKELDRKGYPGFTSLCLFPGPLLLAEDVVPHYAALIRSHTHADFPGCLLSMT